MKATYYDEACRKVNGFEKMAVSFMKQLVINGRSKSTHQNYLRQIAKMSLYCEQNPLEMDAEDVQDYLYYLVERDTDSQSSFKHLVYGLRKLYKLNEKDQLHMSLPSIQRPQRLPVVFSHQEIKLLLKVTKELRDRVMLAFIYDAGLRISEASSMLITDVDLQRKQVHIRQSKNKKDRYVPISDLMVKGIKNYLKIDKPRQFLFERHNGSVPLSHQRIRMILKDAMAAANIKKNACVHSLRHTFATHQLEAGQTIYVLKKLLGHSNIKNTEIYLHIARLPENTYIGTLDKLYEKPKA